MALFIKKPSSTPPAPSPETRLISVGVALPKSEAEALRDDLQHILSIVSAAEIAKLRRVLDDSSYGPYLREKLNSI